MSLAFQERFRDRIRAVGRQGELEATDPAPVVKNRSQPAHSSPLPSSFPFARPLHHQPQASLPAFVPVSSNKLPSKPTPSPVASVTHSTQMFRTPLGGSLSESTPLSKPQLPVQSNTPNPHRKNQLKTSPILKKAIERPALFAAMGQTNTEKIAVSEARSQVSFSPYTLEDYRLIRPTKYLPLGGLGASMIGSQEWLRKKELDSRRRTYGQQVLAANSSHLNFPSHKSEQQDSPFLSSSRQRALDFARSVQPPSPKFPRVAVFLDRRL